MKFVKKKFNAGAFYVSLVLLIGSMSVFGQEEKTVVEDNFEIATFKIPGDETSEKEPATKERTTNEKAVSSPSEENRSVIKIVSEPVKINREEDLSKIENRELPKETVVETQTPPMPDKGLSRDYVFAFEENDPTEPGERNLFDEEYSLSVDGGLVPASKLFTELLEEAAVAQQKLTERLRAEAAEQERLNEIQRQNQAQMAGGAQTGIGYIKRTTLVTSTTSYLTPMNALANSAGVNARVITTDAAWKLVRLASMGDGAQLPVEWAQHMVDAGRVYNVDPILLLEVCRQESRFRNSARSPKEAQGLMQFIPGTAQRFGINPYDPKQALYGGGRYIRFLLDMFRGEVRSALAGYNAGEGAVIAFATGRTIYQKNGKVINGRGSRTLFGIPPYAETQNYVVTIYGNYLKSLERLRKL